jgi:hypothetical protein
LRRLQGIDRGINRWGRGLFVFGNHGAFKIIAVAPKPDLPSGILLRLFAEVETYRGQPCIETGRMLARLWPT